MKFRSTLPLLLLAAAVPGHSVTIEYKYGFGLGYSSFTGVANLSGCSGTLLTDGIHVLTAAHCVATWSGSGVPTLGGISSVAFFTPSGVGSAQYDAVTGVQLNPLTTPWYSADPAYGLMYDIAILDLATSALTLGATGYNLDLSGNAIINHSAVTMAGWGLGGYPSGSVANTGGTERAGTNTVAGEWGSVKDPTLGTVILTDLPIALTWTTTGPPLNPNDILDPNNTTGLPNAGDSGGPLLDSNGDLIGIASFGDLPRCEPDCTVLVDHTYYAGYSNLSSPGNADWIESVLDETPEPGTWMLAAGGALLLWLRRRAIR